MILKYQDLCVEINKLRKTKTKVILIIVRSLDATSMIFEEHFMEIPGEHNSAALIKSALLGSRNILLVN